MGNRSRLRAGKESMKSISEDTESTSRETEASKFHRLKCTDETFGEPCLDRVPNFHCKSLPSRYRDANPEDGIMHKRGSMYQSSGEVSRLRNLQGRSKLNYSSNKDTFLSFEVANSSSQSQPSTSGACSFPLRSYSCNTRSSLGINHRIHQASREIMKLSLHEIPEDDLTLERPRRDCNLLKNDAVDSFLEISLEEDTTKGSCTNATPHLPEGSCSKIGRSDCQQSVGFCPIERDVVNLPKSLSTKVGVFDATCPSECVGNKKARSSPFKKILDPIMKSKSQRNSSLMETEDSKSSSTLFGGKSRVLRKSLLSDISRAEQSLAPDCQINGETQKLTVTSSPTHLHAVIKLDPNHGAFGFVFSTKGPEESIYANTWKAGDELNWIYTFHSSGKRASTVGRTSKDRHGCLPPIVGQMHVSSFLYSSVGEDGTLKNSATTEFVLYDIAHARRSSAVERIQFTDAIRPSFCNVVNNSMSGHTRNDLMQRQNNTRTDSDLSTSCLWSREDLHPHLEVAAIVIQVPFHKTKSKELKAGSSPGIIKAVTAGGAHGLPRDDEASPSPLLDRLKSGGACDCGGWDMSCPIVVLDNAYDSHWADSVMNESKAPMELFAQGNKEVLPALSMKADGNGHFSVDFHARLSALQAFSICISLLHCSEASSDIGIEKFKNKLYSSSLKILLKEEVRQLIDSVTPKEKKQPKSRNEKTPPSIVINPPFSPMGRV
ncbi:hypothetical protein BDA96_01G326100 [Sorghum bicolor]|uniref:DUF3527 domain-containing protein n=1 Tax=Sorghum bicolor TaxID=4558 RepID=A0A921V228_SORBI|nr:hypothetical protein BDA96_01G326100 [Sorghum bicolor]KAG0550287.1 hypothetical protein BDA96_01G326100 [Sorghum bicolor]